MTIYTATLWFYSVLVSLVFGGGMYESFVLHPAWSRNPPESLVGFAGSRMNPKAFWASPRPGCGFGSIGSVLRSSQSPDGEPSPRLEHVCKTRAA
jgi:hypothetical protein